MVEPRSRHPAGLFFWCQPATGLLATKTIVAVCRICYNKLMQDIIFQFAVAGIGGKIASIILLAIFGIAALASIFGMRKVNRK